MRGGDWGLVVMTSELGLEPVFFTVHPSPMGPWGWGCCPGEDRGKKDQEEFVGKGFPILSEEEKTRYGGISMGNVMEPSETEFSYFLTSVSAIA